MALALAAPAAAQEIGTFSEVRIAGSEGVSFEWNRRSYSGELRLRADGDGISVVELVGLDGYLAGIREVPASWPDAALDAQAVAARTYLAWTLDRGRSSSARRYDFDICATTQCQVYAGTGAGDTRWVDAVGRTAGEILLYEGNPAQTMYFSTSGGRTEPIEDIFAGATPKPYLVGAPSPDEPSPLVTWSVTVPIDAFVSILNAGGFAVTDVTAVEVVARAQGEGVWHMDVDGSGGITRVPVADVRRSFNVYGPDLYPDLLPADRPDGRAYRQSILSYRFETVLTPMAPLDSVLDGLPADDRPLPGSVTFNGEGWGHHVGMSQFGALAMAEKGEDYATILGHFYGGLTPQAPAGALPDRVAVGLDWGLDTVALAADGPFTISGDDRTVSVPEGGVWILRYEDGAISVVSGDLLLDRLIGRLSSIFPLL